MWKRLCILILVIAAAILAPAPDPITVDVNNMLAPLSGEHWLGTDQLGRDVWGRLHAGLGRTVEVIIISTCLSAGLGTCLGVVAGASHGPLRVLIMSVTDLVMVVPSFVAALVIAALTGLTPLTAGIALGLFGIGSYVNQSSALARRTLTEDYILAEYLLGTPRRSIVLRHLMPAVWDPVRAYLGATAGGAALSYAGLAFVGLGIDSTIPDWGEMIYDYRVYLTTHPFLAMAPMITLAALVMGLHMALGGERKF